MRNGLIEKVICMTEKRYKRLVSSIDYYYCIDTTNDDKGLTEKDMLNRLNEQDKEIQKLKQKVNGLKSELTIWKEDANEHIQETNKLFEENKQLKQAYQTLKHRHSLLHDECLEAECDRDSLKKDVISLEKENEQLKKELESFEQVSFTDLCDKSRTTLYMKKENVGDSE